MAGYLAVRRALAKDQGRRPKSPIPLWRLLGGEMALLARRVGRWRVVAVTLAVGISALGVEVALSESTPGPALAAPWRWLVAALISFSAICGWAIVHAMRSTRPSGNDAVAGS